MQRLRKNESNSDAFLINIVISFTSTIENLISVSFMHWGWLYSSLQYIAIEFINLSESTTILHDEMHMGKQWKSVVLPCS